MTLPTYNGWPNYPTWNVALWMDNDEGNYHDARNRASMAIADNTSTEYANDDDAEGTETLDRDGAVADLADSLKDWHEDVSPEVNGFVADIFGWAMGFVDWRHIAEHLVDEERGD